ncbi:hypothetical protein N7463_002057 [Penicillium fimorum]|uniref:Uncharacterized protein n=1 Tax=Penicillium fimorum TaxID=1882269 RepID=A0A9W9XZR1_9EURO|nr:hypothetical protein N7463_002057 [Penicillium fimorum]
MTCENAAAIIASSSAIEPPFRCKVIAAPDFNPFSCGSLGQGIYGMRHSVWHTRLQSDEMLLEKGIDKNVRLAVETMMCGQACAFCVGACVAVDEVYAVFVEGIAIKVYQGIEGEDGQKPFGLICRFRRVASRPLSHKNIE